MEKCIIVAIADNLAIGKKNSLLWHIPEDLQYFKKRTLGSPVIMGYMTYKSIGKALPGRLNIVISLFPWDDAPANVVVVDSLEKAYAAAEQTACEKCFVIGGAYTYKEAMEDTDSLYITHVRDSVEDADAFFPEISPKIWRRSWSGRKLRSKSGLDIQFVKYSRREG